MGEKTVCFTGYRPEKMPHQGQEDSPETIRIWGTLCTVLEQLVGEGYTRFISGCCRGFNQWAADAVIRMREQHAPVTLECAIPFPDQAKFWTRGDYEAYCALVHRADHLVQISDHYYKGVYFARNRYMVEQSDFIVAYWDGKAGGTQYTVQYAQKRGKKILNLAQWMQRLDAPQ